MTVFIGHDSGPVSAFDPIDPASFSEPEFEGHVLRALVWGFPDYFCIPFRGGYTFENEIRCADLALVHRTLSHWFVVEVELVSHSLMGHVIPQVRCFRYGEPLPACVNLLTEAIPGLSYERAISLVHFGPKSVVVVANRADREWEACLRGLDAQMLIVRVFRAGDGATARELHGQLFVAQESIGFLRYSATDHSVRLPLSFSVDADSVQVVDPFGSSGTWVVRRAPDAVWLTKERGDPGIPDGEILQVLRTSNGRLRLLMPSVR